MTLGTTRLLTVALGLLLGVACSSGGSGGGASPGTLVSASQDLTADPSGHTTVLEFSVNLPTLLGPANFESSGAQLPVSVAIVGSTAVVSWDDRVTPSHQVRAVSIPGIPSTFLAVTSTNAAAPTFGVSGGTQTPGLGGDSFSVQFAGANVVASTAEDPANWELRVGGTPLDLTGSTFVFDEGLQSLQATLGPGANLHASFELSAPGVLSVADVAVGGSVAATAAGDASAPTLVSVVQDLGASGSEFGLVVEFTFDEAMDPVANGPAGFLVGFPTLATAVSQPSAEVLRVTFNEPVVPGRDTVSLVNVLDAHGNAAAGGAHAVSAGSTVMNAFPSVPVVDTVPNVGGDTVVATFVQALDTDSASDPASWRLESPTGNVIDLSSATFDYDLLAKQLTITLATPDLVTSDSFLFGGSAVPPLDVDGEAFTEIAMGTVTGDTTPVGVLEVTQDRVFDPAGNTFEVWLSEDVRAAAASVAGNYAFTGGASVTSATLLASGDRVRLVVDALTLPGQETLSVQNLVDIAGNVLGTTAGNAIASTDMSAPLPLTAEAFAEEGLDNDRVTVTFDDDLVPAEILDPTNWTFVSPAVNPIDTSMASVTWNALSRTAVLTFDGGTGVNLEGGDYFSVAFDTLRDIAGNVVSPTPLLGNVVSEDVYPRLLSIAVSGSNPNALHLRFSEPCGRFDDPLTAYVLRDGSGVNVGGGTPTVTPDGDGLGAVVAFAAGAVAGTHTLDVRGVTDLAGNQMFAVEAFPIVSEVVTAPVLESLAQSYVAVSGEENDVLTIVFDQPMSPWGLLDPLRYGLTNGPETADFADATMSFDGDRTVVAVFDRIGAIDLDNGAYTLSVDGVLSAQGVPLAGPSMETATAAPGSDTTAASVVSGRSRLDPQDAASVLIELSEALDAASATNASNYTIMGVNPTGVVRLGFRTVRATFPAPVTAGSMVDVTHTDLAGNTGLMSEAVQVAESFGPAVIGVTGITRPGVGGDEVQVTFSQPVGPSRAVKTNYVVSTGGQPVDLSRAIFRYVSGTNTVRMLLPDTVDLITGDTINVMVSNVRNHAGIALSPTANVNGAVGGDTTAPTFSAAYVNYREEITGLIVDVRFSEDVDPGFAGSPSNYGFPGGQFALTATLLRSDTVRLLLSGALTAGDTVQLTGLPDLAGNASGAIQVAPIL